MVAWTLLSLVLLAMSLPLPGSSSSRLHEICEDPRGLSDAVIAIDKLLQVIQNSQGTYRTTIHINIHSILLLLAVIVLYYTATTSSISSNTYSMLVLAIAITVIVMKISY